jgi:hypothetical protein
MTRSLKTMAALVITFALVGAVMNFLGLPRSSTAGAASSHSTLAVSISPEELTRSAGPLPVQEIESYQ